MMTGKAETTYRHRKRPEKALTTIDLTEIREDTGFGRPQHSSSCAEAALYLCLDHALESKALMQGTVSLDVLLMDRRRSLGGTGDRSRPPLPEGLFRPLSKGNQTWQTQIEDLQRLSERAQC